MSRPRFCYERIQVLLRREGWHVDLKHVHRLYCLEGLQVRMRVRRKKRMSLHPGPAPVSEYVRVRIPGAGRIGIAEQTSWRWKKQMRPTMPKTGATTDCAY